MGTGIGMTLLLLGSLTSCLLDWDRDGLKKGADCNDLDGQDAPPGQWYQDEDGDGYGSPELAVTSCLWPLGWSDNDEDCDDQRPSWNPSAEEEWYDGDDVNCDGLNDYDADGDGYVIRGSAEHAGGSAPGTSDCDDTDPSAHPDQQEVWYDGVNQDCGSERDFDADQDGEDASEYGGTDCDDTDPSIRSGVSEDCSNGIDDNCDGVFDDLAWPDADGDGYGDDGGEPIEACEPPAGYAASGDDCDDADGAVHPDAAEICGNGVDDNCTLGDREDCGYQSDIVLSEADGRLFARPLQRPGYALALVEDQDGDGGSELLIGSYGTGAWLSPAGRGLSDLGETALANITRGEQTGTSVAAPGDFDGDGVPDLLIGGALIGGEGAGAAWLLRGPAEGPIAVDGAWVSVLGGALDEAGGAVAGGDLDGDGLGELAIGAPGSSLNSAVGIVPAGASGSLAFSELADRVEGEPGMAMGIALAISPDLDGDGLGELVIGESQLDGGSVYLFSGPISGALAPGDADIHFWAEDSGDAVGLSVSPAGDVDGDGGEDLLIGAPGDDSGAVAGGAVYLITDHGSKGFQLSLASSFGAKILGQRTGDRVGTSLTRAGDLDGDGFAELLLGAPDESASADRRGAVYQLHGPISGTLSLSEADALYTGADSGTSAGAALAVGDLDGDGLPDLAIGAAGPSRVGGEVFLLFGAP